MNRTGLVDAVAAEAGLDRRQAEAAIKAFADVVIAEARAGEKVSIFGFGTFTPTSRAARMGRNPQTNTPVRIAASKGVRFAPASAFKATLNAKKAASKKTAAKKAPAKASASAKKASASKTTAKATKTAAPAKATSTRKSSSKATPATKTAARRTAPVASKATGRGRRAGSR